MGRRYRWVYRAVNEREISLHAILFVVQNLINLQYRSHASIRAIEHTLPLSSGSPKRVMKLG